MKYGKLYIGLKQDLKENNRIVLTDEMCNIDEEITLISNVTGDVLVPKGNKNLLHKYKNKFILDKFKHEQHLVLNIDGKCILISGCSHSGILNILKNVEEKIKFKVGVVIGGLHLYNPINKKTENIDLIKELGNKLLYKDIEIYTCHCTGKKSI